MRLLEITSFLSALIISVAAQGLTQKPLSSTFNNITSLSGTWSTNGAVLTGTTFIDPASNTFHYPNTTGISFSFTDDGHFEESRFRFIANATDHRCIKAVVLWQHGTYLFQPNGSISTTSFPGDGRVQVDDACASTTSVLTFYNQAGRYRDWVISQFRGKYMLQLQAFDGALLPRMYLVTANPSTYMYPTVALTSAANSANPAQSS